MVHIMGVCNMYVCLYTQCPSAVSWVSSALEAWIVGNWIHFQCTSGTCTIILSSCLDVFGLSKSLMYLLTFSHTSRHVPHVLFRSMYISREESIHTWLQNYSKVPNNSAACLLISYKKSSLHALIRTCTFINFVAIPACTRFLMK